MSLLDKLSDEKVWIDFYEMKVDPAFFRISDARALFQYVRQKRYAPVVERILNGKGLSIPVKKSIAKSGSSKKRVVYSLPEDETMVLKLLTWLIIRKYDACLPENLYSFRPHYGAKDALKKVVSIPDISEYYSYKLDVRNYFNSIDIDLLLHQLRLLFVDDEPLYDFIVSQLSDPRAMDEGLVLEERKGAMAGMPYAVFLANVYLAQLDRKFAAMPGLIYCRYSDDIIILSKDKSLLDDAKNYLHQSLMEFHLEINHDKEVETVPGQKWTFLGYECDGNYIDVCKVSVQKLKAKMRRKARALRRWAEVNGKDGWMAARAFIKHFNKKLYICDDRSEINWSLWYFPLITTDKSLKAIDHYMQDCIRYIATGSRTKSRFDFRYEHMKELGLVTLVNEWYKYKISNRELSVR